MISRVGFGCAGIAGHDYGPVDWEQAVGALRAALDAGVTFVDVANVYGLGRAESIVGEAIPAGEDVVVATKVGLCWDDERRTWRDIRPETIERSIEGSLKRLKRDVLDVVQVHWPDGTTPVADAVAALARCREQGKIVHVGVCNFTGDEVEEALGAAELVSLQLPASMIQQASFELLATARDVHGMTPLCYNVLGQGLLTGRYTADDRFEAGDVRQRSVLFREPMLGEALARVRAMRSIARERDATIGQVATRWLLDAVPGSCAILGTKSAAQASQNCMVSEPLTRDEFDSIEAAGATA